MEKVTETPESTDAALDGVEDADLAAMLDTARSSGTDVIEAPVKPAAKPDKKADQSDDDKKSPDSKADNSSERKPDEEVKKPDDKPVKETAYAKARKQQEAERQKNVLSDFDKKQAAFKREVEETRAALAAERQKFEAERNKPVNPLDRYPVNDIKARISQLRDEKKDSDADRMEKYLIGREARETALAEAQNTVFNPEKIKQEWNGYLAQAAEENPDLTDVNSDLHQTMSDIIKDPTFGPVLARSGQGVMVAVEHAKALCALAQQTEKSSALEKENETLKAENERLNKLTSVGKSDPAGAPVSGKTWENMSDEDADAFFASELSKRNI